MCSWRKIHEWPNFPENVILIIESDMLKYPDALKALSEWENLLPEDHLYRNIVCRFGGIDDEPDIDSKGKLSHTEYFECGFQRCTRNGKRDFYQI